MHAGAIVMDDLFVSASHREVADCKGPAGREGEERRHRFADMLPIVGTQDEIRPDNNSTQESPAVNARSKTPTAVDADEPASQSTRDDGETPAVGTDLRGRDVPGRAVVGPDAARTDAGKGALSHTEQSEVPHRQSPSGQHISTKSQVTSGRELAVSKTGVTAGSGTAGQAKGPAHTLEAIADADKPVESACPKVPGRAVPSTVRVAETTARLAAKGSSDNIVGPQSPARLKDAGLSTPVLTNGTRDASAKGPKDGLTVRPEAAPPSVNETAASSSRLSVPTPGGATGATPGSPTRDIGEQILDSLHASLARGDKQITIRLRPPELGTVLVRFREDGEHITGLLEVGKSDVRHEIEQALPHVLRSLHDAGVQIRRFEVVTSDQGQKDFIRDQMQQGGWPHQHGSGENRGPLPGSGQTRWSQDDAGHPACSQEEPNTHPGVAAPGRINMLL
jgi:flagellar hook-length control protein FliK